MHITVQMKLTWCHHRRRKWGVKDDHQPSPHLFDLFPAVASLRWCLWGWLCQHDITSQASPSLPSCVAGGVQGLLVSGEVVPTSTPSSGHLRSRLSQGCLEVKTLAWLQLSSAHSTFPAMCLKVTFSVLTWGCSCRRRHRWWCVCNHCQLLRAAWASWFPEILVTSGSAKWAWFDMTNWWCNCHSSLSFSLFFLSKGWQTRGLEGICTCS